MSTDTIKFLKEWRPYDKVSSAMNKAILKHFQKKGLNTHKGHFPVKSSFSYIDSVLGLAYTSSGIYAGYFICNVSLHYDDTYDYYSFVIGEDGKFYAELQDMLENEKIIELRERKKMIDILYGQDG